MTGALLKTATGDPEVVVDKRSIRKKYQGFTKYYKSLHVSNMTVK